MDRRHFIQTASLSAATAASIVAEAPSGPALAQGSFVGGQQDNSPATNENVRAVRPMTRHWGEQRWVLDNVIQANGVDWDQPRTSYWNAPCGPEASADFAAIRHRNISLADQRWLSGISTYETAGGSGGLGGRPSPLVARHPDQVQSGSMPEFWFASSGLPQPRSRRRSAR